MLGGGRLDCRNAELRFWSGLGQSWDLTASCQPNCQMPSRFMSHISNPSYARNSHPRSTLSSQPQDRASSQLKTAKKSQLTLQTQPPRPSPSPYSSPPSHAPLDTNIPITIYTLYPPTSVPKDRNENFNFQASEPFHFRGAGKP